MHLSVTEAGFEPDGSPIYQCEGCGDLWNDPAETEHWQN